MAIMHPNDQDLQRYLNRRCPELEGRRIGRHIKNCTVCRRKITDYVDMEMVLEELPVLQAPHHLTDRVMSAIVAAERPDALKPEASPTQASSNQRPYWRSELVNGLVATAATYLFMMTGIVGKLMTLDANQLEAGFRTGTIQLFQAVETVSRHLLS